jgi:membrane fusion protein (multidrug efflux system)
MNPFILTHTAQEKRKGFNMQTTSQIRPKDLIPGQYAPVRLILGEDPAALLIPQPALVESQIGKQVFVINQDNKVESRSMEVGQGYQGQWIIKKGLKKGEKVIVEGTQKVRPGIVVNAKPYSAKKGSSG